MGPNFSKIMRFWDFWVEKIGKIRLTS